jgi:hypothetical protein
VEVQRVTRYVTTTDGVPLTYDVSGDGPIDMICMAGGAFPFDLLWDEPGFLQYVRALRAGRRLPDRIQPREAGVAHCSGCGDSDITVGDHGTHVLKGVPNQRRVFAVES